MTWTVTLTVTMMQTVVDSCEQRANLFFPLTAEIVEEPLSVPFLTKPEPKSLFSDPPWARHGQFFEFGRGSCGQGCMWSSHVGVAQGQQVAVCESVEIVSLSRVIVEAK